HFTALWFYFIPCTVARPNFIFRVKVISRYQHFLWPIIKLATEILKSIRNDAGKHIYALMAYALYV
ncbi:MAG: hypothetical protein ACKO9G_30195, partial [Dolichospermum sp.]